MMTESMINLQINILKNMYVNCIDCMSNDYSYRAILQSATRIYEIKSQIVVLLFALKGNNNNQVYSLEDAEADFKEWEEEWMKLALKTKVEHDAIKYIQKNARTLEDQQDLTATKPSIWIHSGPVEIGILSDQLIIIDADKNEVSIPISEIITYSLIYGTPKTD